MLFVKLCNVQNVLHTLARVMVQVRVVVGVRFRVRSRFANCTCVISKLHSAFCKLHRLRKHRQH